MLGVAIDLTGLIFGKLTVVKRLPTVKKRTIWRCLCECGKCCDVRSDHLKTGITSSCGCYRLERLREVVIKHG